MNFRLKVGFEDKERQATPAVGSTASESLKFHRLSSVSCCQCTYFELARAKYPSLVRTKSRGRPRGEFTLTLTWCQRPSGLKPLVCTNVNLSRIVLLRLISVL